MPWAHQLTRTRIKPGFWAWTIALVVFAGSVAFHLLLSRYLNAVKFITFWPAIILTTFLCGWRQGTAVLALSTVTCWYLFLEPKDSFEIHDKATFGAIISFLIFGSFSVVLLAAFRETLDRLESAKSAQQALFSELQHRVANSLQLVVSILRIARRDLRDPAKSAEALRDAEARIMAMAKMHRRLIDRSAFDNGLEPVLRGLIDDAFRDLDVNVRLDLSAASELTVDQMAALTLLVNEAVTNAVKHVFSNGQGTRFEVCLVKNERGRLHLSITDNGPGISPDTEAASFGVGIMKAFAAQLGGSLAVGREAGTRLSVDFECARQP